MVLSNTNSNYRTLVRFAFLRLDNKEKDKVSKQFLKGSPTAVAAVHAALNLITMQKRIH